MPLSVPVRFTMLAASMDRLPLAAIRPLLTRSPLSFKSMLLADKRLPLPLPLPLEMVMVISLFAILFIAV